MSKRTAKYDRAIRRRAERLETKAAMEDMDAADKASRRVEAAERMAHIAAHAPVPRSEPAPLSPVHTQLWELRDQAAADHRRRTFRRRLTVAIGAALLAVLAVAIAARALAAEETAAPLAVNTLPVLTLQVLVDEPREAVGIDENALIEAALLEQGYLSNAVPLDFTLQDVAQTACAEFGVPYPLALAVMEQESGFQTDVISPSGCYGLMQLNPDYFPSDLTPAENIRAGVAHLGELLARHGDTGAALTAYNAGHDTGNRTYADAVLSAEKIWDGQVGCTS